MGSRILQPTSGIGFIPHDIVGEVSHICSHIPSTQRPIRQPILGIGFIPHFSVPSAYERVSIKKIIAKRANIYFLI